MRRDFPTAFDIFLDLLAALERLGGVNHTCLQYFDHIFKTAL